MLVGLVAAKNPLDLARHGLPVVRLNVEGVRLRHAAATRRRAAARDRRDGFRRRQGAKVVVRRDPARSTGVKSSGPRSPTR